MVLRMHVELLLATHRDTANNTCVALLDLAVGQLVLSQHAGRSERFITNTACEVARVDMDLHVLVVLNARLEGLAAEHAREDGYCWGQWGCRLGGGDRGRGADKC